MMIIMDGSQDGSEYTNNNITEGEFILKCFLHFNLFSMSDFNTFNLQVSSSEACPGYLGLDPNGLFYYIIMADNYNSVARTIETRNVFCPSNSRWRCEVKRMDAGVLDIHSVLKNKLRNPDKAQWLILLDKRHKVSFFMF